MYLSTSDVFPAWGEMATVLMASGAVELMRVTV